MKRIQILSIIIVLSLSKSQAQNSTHNSVQISWGMGNIMRQDLTVSPFIHSDWSPVNFCLSYQRIKKLEQQVTLKFSKYNPVLTDPYEFTSFYSGTETVLPTSFNMIGIDYSLGKTILNRKKWSFSLGGKSRNFIYSSDYLFGSSGPSPMFISFGLEAWLKAHYRLNARQYLIADVSVPMVSYVYRDPYLTADDEYFQMLYSHKGIKQFTGRVANGSFRSWGKVQGAAFNIHYGYILNRKWDIGIGYHFSMNFNQHPAKFTQLENMFLIGGKIKF